MNSSFFDVDSGDVSRSGRVRKRSSKLADYDPQDEAELKMARKERRDSGQYGARRKTKVMVTPTAAEIKSEVVDDLGSEEDLQGYEVDGYDTTDGGGAAYDTGDGTGYDDEAAYDADDGAAYDTGDASYETGDGAAYDTGDASYETGDGAAYDAGDAQYGADGGVAGNVEIKVESDEDDDFSNLIMVANDDDDDDGFNDADADADADDPDGLSDGDDHDRDGLSDGDDHDPLVIDEAPTRAAPSAAARRGKPAKVLKQQRKPAGRQKNVSKMWKQQRMTRKDKGQSRITAYLLWAREVRDFVVHANPSLDFSQINKRLGAMWNSLPDAKKYNFKRRAQRINSRAMALEASTTAKMKSTGKGTKGRAAGAARKATDGAAEAATSETAGRQPSMPPPSMSEATSLVNPTNYRVCTTQPVDLAAHMVLLGESLGVIGQKLRDHDGQIAVSGSLSVLLDSLLCALVPLIALTKQVPELDGCDDRDLVRTLDNIAYFMPGL